MGGCSVIVLLFVMMPVMSIYGLVIMAVYVLNSWLTGPAFPFCVIGVILDAICLIDIARIAWRKYKERDAFPITKEVLTRPIVLFCLGAIAYGIMTVITGVQVFSWGMEQIELMEAADAASILCM